MKVSIFSLYVPRSFVAKDLGTAPKAIIRLITGLLTFSGQDYTYLRVVGLDIVIQTASGGLIHGKLTYGHIFRTPHRVKLHHGTRTLVATVLSSAV